VASLRQVEGGHTGGAASGQVRHERSLERQREHPESYGSS
jgi:hypothetical protein